MIQPRKLSKWAALNPQFARGIIALGHIALFCLAFVLGYLTFSIDFEFAQWMLPLTAGSFCLAYFFYPTKNEKGHWNKSYSYRKTLDVSLIAFTYIFLTIGFNQFCFAPSEESNITQVNKMPQAEFVVLGVIKKQQKEKVQPNLFTKIKHTKKQVKRVLKAKVKAMKKSSRTNKGKGIPVWGQILLIAMSIMAGIFIFNLVGLLACNLSCSGHGALAVGVFISGIVGIVIGLFFLIRLIKRKGRNYKGSKKNREQGLRV